MTGPRLLDLFSGAGGAAMGYHRAGFDVVGVDIAPQPHYPFTFHRGDALTAYGGIPGWVSYLGPFDAIHASPPWQDHSIASVRAMLQQTALPWVIENVPAAPMRADYKLCGCMFGLGRLQRQRWFETSWHEFDLRAPCYHPEPAITITTKGQPNRTGYAAEAAEAMGIDWMTMRERGLAIPPAYTEHIGRQLIETLRTVTT